MKYSNNNYYAAYKTILDFLGGPQLSYPSSNIIKVIDKKINVRGACLYLNSKKVMETSAKPFGKK